MSNIILYAKGVSPKIGEYNPGDFILTNTHTLFSKFIQLAQRIRFRGKTYNLTNWSHAALIVSDDGEIIQAEIKGVERSSIDSILNHEYQLFKIDDVANEEDRVQMVKFANGLVGEKYGILTVLSIAFNVLFGANFIFGLGSQVVCSGLVAEALLRTSANIPRPASHVLPAELAHIFNPDLGNE